MSPSPARGICFSLSHEISGLVCSACRTPRSSPSAACVTAAAPPITTPLVRVFMTPHEDGVWEVIPLGSMRTVGRSSAYAYRDVCRRFQLSQRPVDRVELAVTSACLRRGCPVGYLTCCLHCEQIVPSATALEIDRKGCHWEPWVAACEPSRRAAASLSLHRRFTLANGPQCLSAPRFLWPSQVARSRIQG
jgi:hypothetical protein